MATDFKLRELDLEFGPDAVTRATPGYKQGRVPPHIRPAGQRPPFMVVPGLENVALYKPVRAGATPLHGELEQLNDDIKTSLVFDYVEGPKWVQIDLEERYAIHAVVLWHFYTGNISMMPHTKLLNAQIFNNPFSRINLLEILIGYLCPVWEP